MVITTLMATFVALHWKYNPLIVYPVNGSLLALDLLFFASTSTKLLDGGWFPLLIAFVISFLMLTWRKGEEVMDAVRLGDSRAFERVHRRAPPPPAESHPGQAIVLGRMAKGVPLALSHNVKCNRMLKERCAPRRGGHDRDAASVRTRSGSSSRRYPRASPASSCASASWRSPTFPRRSRRDGARPDREIRSQPGDLLYRARDDHPVRRRPGLPRWREAIFAFMHHNAQRPGAYFKIPGAQIMEIGVEFEI